MTHESYKVDTLFAFLQDRFANGAGPFEMAPTRTSRQGGTGKTAVSDREKDFTDNSSEPVRDSHPKYQQVNLNGKRRVCNLKLLRV